MRIEESVLEKMKQFGVIPSQVVPRVESELRREIKRRERELELKEVQLKDPRITAKDLRSSTKRIRRLHGL